MAGSLGTLGDAPGPVGDGRDGAAELGRHLREPASRIERIRLSVGGLGDLVGRLGQGEHAGTTSVFAG